MPNPSLKLTAIAIAVASTLPSAYAIDPNALPIGPNAQMTFQGGKRLTTEQLEANTTLKQTGITGAWSRGFTGKGSTIAILDQGFNLKHGDLSTQVVEYRNFYTETNGSNSIKQSNANWGVHGTAMASAAAGALNGGQGTVGAAFDANLLLGQVGQGGNMPNINVATVIKGLNWAGEQGAVAVNMSFSSSFDKTYVAGTRQIAPGVWQGHANYGAMYGQESSFKLFKSSTNVTSVIVAAAGNQGLAYSGFPGAFATATNSDGSLVFGGRWLIVGSVNANNKLSTFSNAAGSICTNVVSGACKDTYYVKDFYVVAPGERVVVAMDRSASASNTATVMSGTSPAAAIVSGGIALIHQAWPHLKAAEIVQLVKSTATDLGAPGVDDVYGHGLVNFDKATQPYADVKYSKVQLKSGASATGSSLKTTGIATSGPVTTALAGSTVLKNVQIVDGLNRNFTADFTRGIASNPNALVNSFASSPWLAIKSNYREVSAPVSKTSSMTMMQSDEGFATQFNTAYGNSRVSFQVGGMSEKSGFLNNTGSGLFALGDSTTTYAMLGGSTPVAHNIDLIGSYGVGFTKTSNAADSLLKISPTVISDTWKLGLAKKEVFFNGKTTDQFTVALQGPAAIRKGSAEVTAVTGYTYSGAEDDVTATPVTSSERVNLASGTRQMDLVMGYSVTTGYSSFAGVNFAKQFNVNGQPGQNGYAVNIVYKQAF